MGLIVDLHPPDFENGQRRCDLNWLIEEMEGRRSEEVEKAEAEREGDRGGGERDSRQRELLSFNQ